MNRKICLFAPRLDATFKQGSVPEVKNYDNLPPIRKHWDNFVWKMIEYVANNEDSLTIVELPLWQMYPQMVNMYADTYDVVLMPHKQRGDDFHKENIFFYMQTVFPERFTVDRNGWGANLSFLPLKTDGYSHTDDYILSAKDTEAQKFFNRLQKRVDENISKFEQPKAKLRNKWPMANAPQFDVLFVCQIPHDETIKYHSDVSVEDTLRDVLTTAQIKDYSVLVKGHPVNPASMATLKEITKQFDNAIWSDSISIHDALRCSKVVALVNSGVGFEAMLHNKPIFSYGRSEYQNFVHYKLPVDKNTMTMVRYTSFLYEFFEKHTVDTTNFEQFNKVLGAIL